MVFCKLHLLLERSKKKQPLIYIHFLLFDSLKDLKI